MYKPIDLLHIRKIYFNQVYFQYISKNIIAIIKYISLIFLIKVSIFFINILFILFISVNKILIFYIITSYII